MKKKVSVYEAKRDAAAAIEGLKRLRKGRKLGKVSIRQLIEQGRRDAGRRMGVAAFK